MNEDIANKVREIMEEIPPISEDRKDPAVARRRARAYYELMEPKFRLLDQYYAYSFMKLMGLYVPRQTKKEE